MNLLSIRNLEVEFDGAGGPQRVIHGIGLDLGAGEVLAVVGESGSGKSVTAAAILGLLPERDSRARGSIRFEGRELLGLPEAALNGVRGAGIGIIFQNSLSSLDPSFRIGEQMTEGLRFRRRLDAQQPDGSVVTVGHRQVKDDAHVGRYRQPGILCQLVFQLPGLPAGVTQCHDQALWSLVVADSRQHVA